MPCCGLMNSYKCWRKAMALTNCPECGKEISDSVKKCPHCGKKIKDNKIKEFIFKHKIIFGLFIIICVYGGAAIIRR